MAMRQRSGGISSTTRPRQSINRPTYEDFQPHFESKEEHQAQIIQLHLPEFVRQQLEITFVHSGEIKVHGKRPLGNNKWSRFNQTFRIPQNSDASKIHAKINNGILTITIPKQGITQAPKPAAISPLKTAAEAKPHKLQDLTTTSGPLKTSSDPNAEKGQQGIPQTAIAAAQDEKQRDNKNAPSAAGPREAVAEAKEQLGRQGIPLTPTFTARDGKERDHKNADHPLAPPKGIADTKAQKDKDEALPKVVSAIQNEKHREEKRVVPLTSPERSTSEPKFKKSQDEVPPKGTDQKRAESTAQSVDRKEVENKDRSEAHGKVAEAKNAEKVVKTALQKERETNERNKQARAVTEIVEKAKKKTTRIGRADQDKPKEEDSIAANAMAAAKEGMKNLGKRMSDEEKQMLINIGAAVLVLVALGAYASYSFWSSGKAKN